MNDMTNGALAPTAAVLAPRKDYLTTIEGRLAIAGRAVEIAFELCGHYVVGFGPAERAGCVIDAVLLGEQDVTRELGPEILEVMTTYLNEVM